MVHSVVLSLLPWLHGGALSQSAQFGASAEFPRTVVHQVTSSQNVRLIVTITLVVIQVILIWRLVRRRPDDVPLSVPMDITFEVLESTHATGPVAELLVDANLVEPDESVKNIIDEFL
jgi:hypothetical protein